MRSVWITSSCVVALAAAILVVGGVGYNDEVSYLPQGGSSVAMERAINIQNTGSFHHYLGLVGLRRYGTPFELFINFKVPGGAQSVVLRDFVVRDGNRTAIAIAQAALPVDTVTVLSGDERRSEDRASYRHPETFALSAEVASVSGTLTYESADGTVEFGFEQEFQRIHERGFFTGL